MDWGKIKDGIKTKISEDMREIADKKEELKARVKQMDKDGTVYCPKCYSTNISANKKGYSLGKAIIGGPAAGLIGKNKIEITCLKCGNKWKAGKK